MNVTMHDVDRMSTYCTSCVSCPGSYNVMLVLDIMKNYILKFSAFNNKNPKGDLSSSEKSVSLQNYRHALFEMRKM